MSPPIAAWRTSAAILATVLVTLFAAHPLAAQRTGLLAGVVVDDARGDAVPGARVTVSSWRGEVRTDAAGRFRIEAAPAGTRTVRIEAPGYDVIEVEVTIPSPAASDATYRLTPAPVALQGLEAKAEGVRGLPDFERRRTGSTGGRFLTRRDLATRETSTLTDVLRSTMPGAQLVRSQTGPEMFLASKSGIPPGALKNPGQQPPCFTQVIVDGIKLYGMGTGGGGTPPDLGSFPVRDLEAVEYYAHVSSTPVEFRTPTSQCGTLVLWTRRS
jgi:hypothetical protein